MGEYCLFKLLIYFIFRFRLLEHQSTPVSKKSKATQGWLWRLCARWMSEALQDSQTSVQPHQTNGKPPKDSSPFNRSSHKGALLVQLLELIDRLPIAFSHLTALAPSPAPTENGTHSDTVDSLPKSIRALKKHTDSGTALQLLHMLHVLQIFSSVQIYSNL